MSDFCSQPFPNHPYSPRAVILYGIRISDDPVGFAERQRLARTQAAAPKRPSREGEKEELKHENHEEPSHEEEPQIKLFRFGALQANLALKITVTPHGGIAAGASPFLDYRIGSIYGYAFEGHCYKFDRPKILIFKSEDKDLPASGCAFDTPRLIEKKMPNSQYFMWRVDRLDEAVEITTGFGFIDELVLQANLPGRRTPNTYSANMQVAHRGGRLTT